jgi:hypothetical protein
VQLKQHLQSQREAIELSTEQKLMETELMWLMVLLLDNRLPIARHLRFARSREAGEVGNDREGEVAEQSRALFSGEIDPAIAETDL